MQIIKVAGKPRVAEIRGRKFEYKELIWMQSERGWFRQLDYDNHFIYRQNVMYGSALLCTCGGVAALFGYEAYSQYSSTNYGRILCCVQHANTGRHADGST